MAKVAAEVGSTANKYEVLAKLATGGIRCDDKAMTKARASTCVLLACRLHETAKARKWITFVPAAKRGETEAACWKFGTVITPAPQR